MDNPLYFAYGSNMNRDDWWRWCRKNGFPPDVLKYRSIAYLPDYDVCFSYRSRSRNGGVLDLRRREGQIVPGVVFEILGDGWKALDKKEGVPGAYERMDVTVLDELGTEVAVQTYEVSADQRQPFVTPGRDYVDIVRQGLESYGLPTGAVDAASENRSDVPLLWSMRSSCRAL